MTEQEQIEKWRKEFELMIGEENTKKNGAPFNVVGYSHLSPKEGSYRLPSIDSMWQGFLMAKRNMPVIELPQGHLMDDPDGMGSGRYIMIETVERALNRAGAKYTIKGE